MGQPAQKTPQRTWGSLVTRELCAGLGLGLLYPLGFISGKRDSRRLPKDHKTLVLVHGYLGNRTSLLPIKSYLQFHGVKNIVNFEYSSKQSVEKSAIELATFLKKHVRGGKVDFLCHSLGGVIARVYLQMLGGARRCDRCITIGSPHHGTYNAYWAPSLIGRDLRPDSNLFRRLNRFEISRDCVKFTSIAGNADNIILPRSSAGKSEVHNINDTGHLGLLWSPKTMKIVLDELTSAHVMN